VTAYASDSSMLVFVHVINLHVIIVVIIIQLSLKLEQATIVKTKN